MKPLALLPALLLLCAAVPGQEKAAYSGPRPPKPDVPYLMHADDLIEPEVAEAREEQRGKDEVAYVVAGAASPVRTPMAEPIFLFHSEKITPESLGLYRFEIKKGNREVVVSKKKRDVHPLRLMVTPLGEHLFRIEVNEGMGLDDGEYSLSPEGSNTVFCFSEY